MTITMIVVMMTILTTRMIITFIMAEMITTTLTRIMIVIRPSPKHTAAIRRTWVGVPVGLPGYLLCRDGQEKPASPPLESKASDG